uniref:Acriflavin resistance protein n=1 Tax=uncultured Thiotrichaceae bacterium TaxID=298394 RepID=A0A6S6U822_9GAMM|nr:MAG: Acriflavin resistance protein [uncultured Thiotrichaceae bacterium]
MNESNPNNSNTSHNLGLAGRTAKAFIVSPLSLLLLLSFLAIGTLGLMITPRQEDPQISVPMADVFVRYAGASAEEVEAIVARPLEGLVSEITGVKHVYSASMRGEAMITVQFKVGQDLETSLFKLYDKLASNMDSMPQGISQPLVKPKGVDDVPVVTVTLWSNEVDDASLRLVGLEVLQELREVPNTSQSFIVDGRRDEVRVEIMPERLATFGVSLDQVVSAVKLANSERKTGGVEPSSLVYNVYSGSFLKSAADIKRLMVAVIDGRPVYVRDVAKVVEGPSEASRMVGYYTGQQSDVTEKANNAAAVTLAIAKKHGTNGVDVAEAILERLDKLKGQLIPDNIQVAITRDYGKSAKAKVNALMMKLFIATMIVAVLVLLALGWRASAVVLLVIPSVITTTVFAAWAFGMTIDRVSLFALIFSIGILVDDAIVVVENIYRRWLLAGSQALDIAVDAVREVGNPTILATATVIAALLPMGFVSGMMGPYMMPIPVLGSVAMVISLFAAFAFTPWLTNAWKPSLEKLHADAEKEHKQAERMERLFRSVIIPLSTQASKGYAFLFAIIISFFLLLTLFYPLKAVPVKMMPLDNKSEFNVVVNMPEGTALPVMANVMHELATELQALPDVVDLQSYSGVASPFNFNGLVRHYYLRQQPWQGDIQVQLTDKSLRSHSSHDVAVVARELLTPIAAAAGARIQVVEMPPGPPVLQTVVAEIYNPDAVVRRQVAKDMTALFRQADNLTDVDNLMEEDYEMLRFVVDTDKAQRNGISVEDVNRTLEMAMGGYVLGDIKRNALIDPTRIILQVPLSARSQIMRLVQLPVTNQQGRSVSLSELGSFKRELQDKPIFHKDMNPVEFVTAEGIGRLAAPVYGQKQVEALLQSANDGKGYRVPDGTTKEEDATYLTGGHWFGTPANAGLNTAFEWGGEWTVTFETFRDMGVAFAAALVLIYMLIVAQFGNFMLPAIIMAPIPLTLIGIIPGHWVMGAEFTATSMIGFIALAGIIVRNSILLVDFARESVRNDGVSVTEAVIRSCEARTRPILITALALLGGSMVILSDPIFQGMAVSLIFGGAVSTLLTLLVIPLGCISAGDALRGADYDDGSDPDTDGGGAGGSAPVFVKESSKKKLTIGKVVKNTAVFSGMYVLALLASVKDGVADVGRAGLRWKRKRAANGKQVRADQKVQTAAELSGNTPEAMPEPEVTAEPVTGVQNNESVTLSDEPEVMPVETETSPAAAETSKVEEKNDEVVKNKPVKPAKRRGIKLKKDI